MGLNMINMHYTTLRRQLKWQAWVVSVIGNILVNNILNKYIYKQSTSPSAFIFSFLLKSTSAWNFLTKTSSFRVWNVLNRRYSGTTLLKCHPDAKTNHFTTLYNKTSFPPLTVSRWVADTIALRCVLLVFDPKAPFALMTLECPDWCG